MDLSEPQNKATIKGEIDNIESVNRRNKVGEAKGDGDLSLKAVENIRDSSSPMPLPAGGQLTMFYNGSVSVYDAVTPEKAQAIMLIAAAASSSSSANNVPIAAGPNTSAVAAAALMRSLSQQSSSAAAAATAAPSQPNSLCKLQTVLPSARRQSLQQFLEKRRGRLVSKGPYAPAKKPDEGMEVSVEAKP